jgi:hypothetical protein
MEIISGIKEALSKNPLAEEAKMIRAETPIEQLKNFTEKVSDSFALSESEIEKLVPIPITNGSFFQINGLVENVAISERHASFFSSTEYKEIELTDLPDFQGVQIRLGDKELNISLKEGDALSQVGIKNQISYALSPALEEFVKIRLSELRPSDVSVVERLESADSKLASQTAFAVRATDSNRFFQYLEKVSNTFKEKSSEVLCAKRIDYLVGSEYIPGKICNVPIVGGVSNWVFKEKLAFDMETKDWAKLGDDVFMVVSIAAIPLAPVSGGLAMAGWVAANATFGAVSQGVISHLNGNNESQSFQDAGKGALLGAVGGAAGVAAAKFVIPAISNKLLATAASGATVGSSTNAAAATIRVIESGEDFESAAKEIGASAFLGAITGGAFGAGAYGVTKVVTKLQSSISELSHVDVPTAAKAYETFKKSIEPTFPTNRPLHGGDIRNYAKKLDTQSYAFAAHLKQMDEGFNARFNKIGTQLSEAVTENNAELMKKLERQLKIGLAGDLAEAKVKEIFEPFFDKITTQIRVLKGKTIIDMVAEGAKHPIALKGHRYIEKGGSLPIEVKAGTEKYFDLEIKSGHLLKQVGGHEEFGKGLVVTTRDVGDAIMKTGRAREILKEYGSSPFRLLPPKSELDEAITQLLKGEFAEALKTWSPWSIHLQRKDGMI